MFLTIFAVLSVVIFASVASLKEATPVIYGDIVNGGIDKTAPGDTITIGTYNIHSGKGVDGKRSLRKTAEVLSSPPLDFVGLNEVRNRLLESRNQAQQLSEMLGLGWVYAPTRKKMWYPHFGNAFLSRFRVKSYKVEPLVFKVERRTGSITSRAHRNVTTVKLDFDGEEVTILVTHLDRGPLREEQLSDVLNRFKQCSPAILMGDFNTFFSDALLQKFLGAGLATDVIGDAFQDRDDPVRIDWILTRGFSALEVGEHPKGVSDHPQYWAKLELTKG